MLSRLCFLFLGFTAGLYASSITSVSCMLGATTQMQTSRTFSRCSILDFEPQGNFEVDAEAAVNRIGNGLYSTDAYGAFLAPGPVSYHALAKEDLWFQSDGPARNGTVLLGLIEPFAHGCCASGSLSDGVNTYGPTSSGGMPPVMLPFRLGVPFHLSLLAEAGLGCVAGACGPGYQDPQIYVDTLSLFEADGTTSVSFNEISAPVPEPANLAILLMGVLLLSVTRLRRPGA